MRTVEVVVGEEEEERLFVFDILDEHTERLESLFEDLDVDFAAAARGLENLAENVHHPGRESARGWGSGDLGEWSRRLRS